MGSYYDAYCFGVRIGLARVLASLENIGAWNSIASAKTFAKNLCDAKLLGDFAFANLNGVSPYDDTAKKYVSYDSLRKWLEQWTDGLGELKDANGNRHPFGTLYYLGFWTGNAEAQASTYKDESKGYKDSALLKAKEFASKLTFISGISPNELYIGETWENITKTRQGWEEILKGYDPNALSQKGWKWCNKCQALFMGDNAPAPCAKGGVHDSTGSGNYALAHNDPNAIGQKGWKWCNKCQVLFMGDNAPAPCAKGGVHDSAGSGNYTLAHNNPNAVGQKGWKWCNKCQVLFMGDNAPAPCAKGGVHDSAGSGDYTVNHSTV